MAEYLYENIEQWGENAEGGNATRTHQFLASAIREVFKDCAVKSKAKKRPKSPFQVFRRRHVDRPDIPMLIKAEADGDADAIKTHIQTISREGWQERLANIRATVTRALFQFLAKGDGGQPLGRTYSRSAPLQNEHGVRQFDATAKCALLAEHFLRKLSAPEALEEEKRRMRADGGGRGKKSNYQIGGEGGCRKAREGRKRDKRRHETANAG